MASIERSGIRSPNNTFFNEELISLVVNGSPIVTKCLTERGLLDVVPDERKQLTVINFFLNRAQTLESQNDSEAAMERTRLINLFTSENQQLRSFSALINQEIRGGLIPSFRDFVSQNIPLADLVDDDQFGNRPKISDSQRWELYMFGLNSSHLL